MRAWPGSGALSRQGNPFSAWPWTQVHTSRTAPSLRQPIVSLETYFGFRSLCSSLFLRRLTFALGRELLLDVSSLVGGQGYLRTWVWNQGTCEPAKLFLCANIPEKAGPLLPTAPKCLPSELTTSQTSLTSLPTVTSSSCLLLGNAGHFWSINNLQYRVVVRGTDQKPDFQVEIPALPLIS